MARVFQKPNVGTTGRRRLVPMMGIDFIAGDIKNKSIQSDPERYGKMPASMGGRTRRWSFINFLLVTPNNPRPEATTQQMTGRENFANATGSSRATFDNLTVLAQLTADWQAGTVYGGVDPNNYATPRGWVTAVRFAQIRSGVSVTPTYTTWPPVFS